MSGVFRRIDLFGLVAFVTLAGLVAAGVYGALAWGWFKSVWELAAWCGVAVAFVGVALGTRGRPTPKNTFVHGAARPADEREALGAARGNPHATKLDHHTFDD